MMQDSTVTTRRLAGAPLRDALLAQVRAVVMQHDAKPRLAIVQVGDDERSSAYIRHKLAACARVGIAAEVRLLPGEAREEDLHALLRELSVEPRVTAIIAQTPLPAGWDVQAALDVVPALKDCDGLTTANQAKLAAGDTTALAAATPLGVLRLLTHPELGAGMDLRGKTLAIIGNGLVVGRPLRALLKQQGATVLGIDKDTPDPAAVCRQAEIVCAAAGQIGLVTREWLRSGAVVIDIGLTRRDVDGQSKLFGDVDAGDVAGIAGLLTPVPGGVGPLTVASLLTNVVDGWLMQRGEERVRWG